MDLPEIGFIDAKTIVNASIFTLGLYIFVNAEWSIWIMVAVAGIGLLYFNNSFTETKKIKRQPVPKVGLQEPFIDPTQSYERVWNPQTEEYEIRAGIRPPPPQQRFHQEGMQR